MSDCVVYETSLGAKPFTCEGEELAVDMRWVFEPVARHAAGEEMIAVIEGAAVVTCDGEVHKLVKGQGVLIPAGADRSWSFDTPALLYRVSLK